MPRKIKLLIDECLHTSLVPLARGRNYEAYHVSHMGMAGLKDHEIISKIRQNDYTFVTNNAVDFRRLFAGEALHAGVIIILPNVVPGLQRALLEVVLEYVGDRDLTNRAIEVDVRGEETEVREYEIPRNLGP